MPDRPTIPGTPTATLGGAGGAPRGLHSPSPAPAGAAAPAQHHATLATDSRAMQLLRLCASRRRQLLLLRGISAGLAVLLGSMLAVAIVDRLMLPGDGARLALSLVAYTAALGAAWFVGLRHLLAGARPAQLARLIEACEPEMQHRLLAALELRRSREGSSLFRQLVDLDASARAARVEVERVLPWQRSLAWAAPAAAAILLCAALLMIPQLQFGRMLGRALLPGADIPRASRYTVAFVNPASPLAVPRGEEVRIEVDVVGPSPRQVRLEISPDGGQRRTIPLSLVEEPLRGVGRYAATVRFDGPATIRARADDADTPQRSVVVATRPAVVAFEVAYQPPEYVRAARSDDPQTSAELRSVGHLDALAGSIARITLHADQPIAMGHVELLASDQRLPGAAGASSSGAAASHAAIRLPLRIGDDSSRPFVEIPIRSDAAYRVHLEAAETGLEAAAPPLWRITARPDTPPTLAVISPSPHHGGSRPLPRDALLNIRLLARDDVGLAAAWLDVRVDGREWQPLGDVANLTPRTSAAHSALLDLLPMGLSAGDRVEVRAAARDLSGQTVQQRVGEWVVVADAGDVQRRERIERLEAMGEAVHRLAREVEGLSTAVRSATGDAGAATGADHLQARRGELLVDERLRQSRSAARDLQQRALDAVTTLPPGLLSEDVVLLGSAAAELAARTLPRAVRGDYRGQLALERAERLVYAAEDFVGAWIRAEHAAAGVVEVHALARDARHAERQLEAALADQQPQIAWERFSRRQSAAELRVQQARVHLDAARFDLSPRNPVLARIDQVRLPLDQASERLRRALRGEAGSHVRDPARRLREALDSAPPLLHPALVDLAGYAQQRRKRLIEASPTLWGAFADATWLDEPGDWQRIDAWLGDLLDIAERRGDADHVLVADLSLMRQAARALHERHLAMDAQDSEFLAQRAAEVARAVAVLEDGARLRRLVLDTTTAANAEQAHAAGLNHGGGRDLHPYADLPRHWDATSQTIADLAQRHSRGVDTTEISTGLQPIASGPALHHAGAALADRLSESPAGATAPKELREVLGELRGLRSQIEPALEEARQVLREQATSIAQWMRQLAAEADSLAEENRGTEQATGETASLRARSHQSLEAELRQLEAAIRRQAAGEDLLSHEGRERARDADAAMALLRPDAAEARRHLAEARRAAERFEQLQRGAGEEEAGESLVRAGEAQHRLAAALRQLADHWEARDRRDPGLEASRQALREAEEELGIREQLDEEYGRMERLAEMTELERRQMLEALERELAQDETMRRELSRLAQEAARSGESRLAEAAQRERDLLEEIGQAAEPEGEAGRMSAETLEALADAAEALERERVTPLREQSNERESRWQEALARAEQALRDAHAAAREASRDREAAQPSRDGADDPAAAEEGAADAPSERRGDEPASPRDAAMASRDALASAAERLEAAEAAQRDALIESAAKRRELEEDLAAARQAGRDADALQRQAQEVLEATQQERDLRQQVARTQEAAQEARRLEEVADEIASGENERTAQATAAQRAAAEQEALADQASDAAADLARAGRHEQRLGEPDRASAMEDAAQAAQDVADHDLPRAAREIEEDPQRAEEALAGAAEALEQVLRQAADAQATPHQHDPSASPEPEGSSSRLAQALDQLDRLAGEEAAPGGEEPGEPGPGDSGEPGDDPGQTGQDGQSAGAQQAAREAAREAAEAQANAIRQRRLPSPGGAPDDSPGPSMHPGGAPDMDRSTARASDQRSHDLPAGEGLPLGERPAGDGDWGRLPPDVVRDLLQGRRENAPPEYRDLVEAYWRALARRARDAGE